MQKYHKTNKGWKGAILGAALGLISVFAPNNTYSEGSLNIGGNYGSDRTIGVSLGVMMPTVNEKLEVGALFTGYSSFNSNEHKELAKSGIGVIANASYELAKDRRNGIGLVGGLGVGVIHNTIESEYNLEKRLSNPIQLSLGIRLDETDLGIDELGFTYGYDSVRESHFGLEFKKKLDG